MVGRGLVLGVAALCASSTFARAECADPHWIGTRPRSVIPLHGDLYVYREVRDYEPYVRSRDVPRKHIPGSPYEFDVVVDSRWIGVEGVVTQTRISSKVVKVHYEGAAGSSLVLDDHWTYTLSSSWHAPYAAPRVLAMQHHVGSWTCSTWDYLDVTLDQPTAAIRARWTFAGETREWIVPADESYGDKPSERLALGKISCGGTTLPPRELLVGGTLELSAIRLDGTEVLVTGSPTYIAANFVTQVRHDDDDVIEVVRSADECRSIWSRALLAGGLFVVGAWLARRARARAVLRYPRET